MEKKVPWVTLLATTAALGGCATAPSLPIEFSKGAAIYTVPVHGTECDTLSRDYVVDIQSIVPGPRDSDQVYTEIDNYADLPSSGDCAQLPNFSGIVYLDLSAIKR